MTLFAGDLTTPARFATWAAVPPPSSAAATIAQLITSMSALIRGKLNRARLYSQSTTQIMDGTGTGQLVLNNWPVTSVTSVQIGAMLLQPYALPSPTIGAIVPPNTFGYGYRVPLWQGNLPGSPSVIEIVNGTFWPGIQNVKIVYTAGYLIQDEQWTVPVSGAGENTVTVLQPQGIWCRDNGVVNAITNATLTPVASAPASGQYVPPPDTSPGLYTFNAGDVAAGLTVDISYSFIPADLEEACIQMVAERYSYRNRIGELSKSLAGQETISFLRGGGKSGLFPPEVELLLSDYISVLPPSIGAPV